ncbi:MAG: hypothetical protein EOO77_31255 [Oxalobacteraceae bacterium]|nr:MAG: hypothetical protein EOO77_31255 [Oxalobacteraceae bacterium]
MPAVISMSNHDKAVAFCVDDQSGAVLTVILARERLKSWWIGKGTLDESRARYSAEGLSDCEVPVPLQDVIDRRWTEIDMVRPTFS